MRLLVLFLSLFHSGSILANNFDLESLKIEVKEANYFANSNATMLSLCKVKNSDCVSIIDGYVAKGSQEKIDDDSIMLAGSISKFITGTMFMMHVEKGLISLEDNLTDYFPKYKLWRSVKIKHLLSHRSGLPAYLFSIRAIKLQKLLKDRTRKWTPDEILYGISTSKLEFKPGSQGKYANTNYLFLGMILEKVTGKTLNQLYNETIIKPLNLTNTFYEVPESEMSRLVKGYVSLPGTKLASQIPELFSDLEIKDNYLKTDNLYHKSLVGAAGGLTSNAYDVAKFTTALFNGKLVNLETLEKMKHDGDMMIGPTGYHDYGYGFEKTKNRFGIAYGHKGLSPGYQSLALYIPDHDLAITGFQSVGPSPLPYIADQIAGVIGSKKDLEAKNLFLTKTYLKNLLMRGYT